MTCRGVKAKFQYLLLQIHYNCDNVDQFYYFRVTTLERNKNAERSVL